MIFRSLSILTACFFFTSATVHANECGRVGPQDRFDKINQIVECLENKIKALQGGRNVLSKTDNIVLKDSQKCKVFPPNSTSHRFQKVRVGDIFCTSKDQPFLKIVSITDKGSKYLTLQDGEQKFRCFLKDSCKFNSKPTFSGTINISYVAVSGSRSWARVEIIK